MDSLYGEFKKEQIVQVKKSLRGNIFFLLLCADPSTSEQYKEVDVNKSFKGLLLKLNGLNELLLYQPKIVEIMSLLLPAMIEYNSENFDFSIYRKLILDAGAEVQRLKEE